MRALIDYATPYDSRALRRRHIVKRLLYVAAAVVSAYSLITVIA